MKLLLKKLILLSITTLLTLVALEAFARILTAVAPYPHKDVGRYLASKPAPYDDIPFDWDDFMESFQSRVDFERRGDMGIVFKDYSSKSCNIRDGMRLTTDRPAEPAHNLYVFGGSTIFCGEVPDGYTIPSYLQRALNASTQTPYAVHNVSASSLNVKNQLARLEQLKDQLKADDVVVFYDGSNDTIQSLYYLNPNGSMSESILEQYESMGFVQRNWYKVVITLARYSVFVDRFLNPIDARPHRENISFSDELLQTMQEAYTNRLHTAYQLCQERNVRFLHFLQPQLFELEEHTDFEKMLLQNGVLIPPNLEKAYDIGYPLLRDVQATLRKQGVSTYDLSNALNKRTSEVFLDWHHINHVGNELVVEAMLPILLEKLGKD